VNLLKDITSVITLTFHRVVFGDTMGTDSCLLYQKHIFNITKRNSRTCIIIVIIIIIIIISNRPICRQQDIQGVPEKNAQSLS